MLCQKCNKNEASVRFTQVINGQKSEVYLCHHCASEMGDFGGFSSIENLFDFNLGNFFNGILGATQSPKQAGVVCPTCGMGIGEFSKLGKFGCADCFRAFGDTIDPLFRRVQGNVRHVGKVPGRCAGDLKLKRELETLKSDLKKAIEQEEFEEAARLRDKIKELEKGEDK